MATPGWYRDPTGAGDGRYWNGQTWTDQVTRAGITMASPVGAEVAAVPPAPGTEFIAQPPTSAAPSPAPPSRSQGGLGPVATIVVALAVIIAIVALVIALTRDSNDDSEAPPTEQPTEQPTEEPQATPVPE
jgi:hypothetical protein